MNCLFCEKSARLEPFNKKAAKIVDIWRCPECRAQFDCSPKTNNIIKICFFVDIKDKTYAIQSFIEKQITKIQCVGDLSNKIVELPIITNLTPQNAANKLKLCIMFS